MVSVSVDVVGSVEIILRRLISVLTDVMVPLSVIVIVDAGRVLSLVTVVVIRDVTGTMTFLIRVVVSRSVIVESEIDVIVVGLWMVISSVNVLSLITVTILRFVKSCVLVTGSETTVVKVLIAVIVWYRRR